jgi:type III secretion system FlhB-like substrate exporter
MLAIINKEVFITAIATISSFEQQEKIVLELLDLSIKENLYSAIDAILESKIISDKIEENICKKIIQKKEYHSTHLIQDNKNIVDLLIQHKLLDEITYPVLHTRSQNFQYNLWNVCSQIKANSYLASKIMENEKVGEANI